MIGDMLDEWIEDKALDLTMVAQKMTSFMQREGIEGERLCF